MRDSSRWTVKAGFVMFGVACWVMGAQAQEPDPDPLEGTGRYDCTVTWSVDGEVVKLNCVEDDSPLNVSYDFEVMQVRRFLQRFDDSDVLQFEFRNLRIENDELLYLDVTFNHGGGYVSYCEELISVPRPGGIVEESVYVDICGTDRQWNSVEIAPRNPAYDCKGCGTFRRLDLTSTRTINLDSLDQLERSEIINELLARP